MDRDRNDKPGGARDVHLSQADREEIWQAIEAELALHKESKRKDYVPVWRYSLASLVALVVVGAGILTYVHEGQHQVTSPNISTVTESNSTIQPEMFLFPEWRVVVSPSMEKQGPYYNIDYYYTGLAPAHLDTFVYDNTVAASPGEAGNLIPQQRAAGHGELYFPDGLQGYHATLKWHEHGIAKTNLISLTGPSVPLRILKSVQYSGTSLHWHGTLRERVVGNDSFHTGIDVMIRLSSTSDVPQNGTVNARVLCDTGYTEGEYQVVNGQLLILTGFETQSYKGQLVRGVEITWQGHKETVQFSKQND